MKSSCETVFILALIYCNKLTTADKTVNYINFSEEETVILKCISGADRAVWDGPAQNSSNPSLVSVSDPFGKEKIWMTTKYADDREINPLIPNLKRLRVFGNEGNFDLEISNASLCDQGYYRCTIDSAKGNHLQAISYILLLKNKPKVFINQEQTTSDVEGSRKKLCCEVDSHPNISFILWFKDYKSRISNTSSLCLLFEPLTRQDSGNYTCVAGNEIGNRSFTASLIVFYPPFVYLTYNNIFMIGNKREVRCKGDGLPNTLTFFRVEHKSYFNEHIRYIEVSSDGIATLPPIEALDRYQDTGLYVCNASNDVPNREGNKFQQGEAYLVSDAQPVFVANNKKVQYVEIGKPMDITVRVYSTSEIKCLHLNAIGSLNIMKIFKKSVPLMMSFHGVNITENGIEVTFRLAKLQSFQWFDITVCNNFSINNFILEGIVIIVLLILIVVLLVVMGIHLRYLKQRYRKRMITTTNVQTADKSAHYVEIVEDNNEMAILHEQNNQMISTDARNISMVSEELHLAFSNNDCDTSEHSIATSDNDTKKKQEIFKILINGFYIECSGNTFERAFIERMKTCFLFTIFLLGSDFTSQTAVIPRIKYEYYSQGETVLLKCMTDANKADWIGPAQNNMSGSSPVEAIDIYGKRRKWNTSLYATCEQINPNLSHKNRLKIDDNEDTGDCNLQIRNFSKNDEGIYICHYINQTRDISVIRFVLQEKTYPSQMIFENATKENVLDGVAHIDLKINCSVKRGKPPETLSLIRHKKTVMTDEHGNIEYTFTPTSLDHNVIYTCEAKNPMFIQPLRRNVRLNIKYKPVVSTIGQLTEELNEGGKKNICCDVKSNPAPKSTRLMNGSHEIFVERYGKYICYPIERVSRYDTGNYTCIAENEIGSDSATVILIVKYPPDVHLDYKNFTINDEMRTIQCTAKGFPSNYKYGVWEHRSEFNEHIRYLNSTDSGTLILPRINEAAERYQDSGYYICMVTNGVPNMKHFQQGKAYVVSQGPPVFVKQNMPIQYSATGKGMTMRVYILSYSKIICQVIKALNNREDENYIHVTYIRPLKVGEMFHGQNIVVNGIEMMFVFERLEQKHYQMYKITVCNKFGNRSYTVHLVSTANKASEEKSISVEGIVIVVLLILIFVLLSLMGWRYLKHRYRKRMTTSINDQIAGRNSDERAHYIEISEDNMLTTLQENSNQIISTDARTVFMSEEQDLEFSNNDTSEHAEASSENDISMINASEYLDDGYEHPYTTLVEHSDAADEHVYLNTKTNSINENPHTFQNVTYKHSFASKVQDYSQDKQQIHFFASDGQENVTFNCPENNLNETDNDFYLLNVNAAEYINLSLKQ
ncbi:unnamed protein product [Mytilus coruscus]|uniref:Ig-like domain-containing protein n=1 Tax=Mytilus coruscus TaxID=42192 RepID=A0A6J8AIV5_MYTCO|nr:unnamed protein product [Mytilus coruscus]